MLILTGSLVDDKTEVLCSVCYKVVGTFELSEIGEMSKRLDAIYCFDCDPAGADSVHPALYGEDERYFIWFGSTIRSINLLREVRVKEQIIQNKNGTIQNLYDHLREIFSR